MEVVYSCLAWKFSFYMLHLHIHNLTFHLWNPSWIPDDDISMILNMWVFTPILLHWFGFLRFFGLLFDFVLIFKTKAAGIIKEVLAPRDKKCW